MRHVLFTVFLIILAVNFTAAQQTPITPNIDQGDRALLFTFNGLGTFGIGGSSVIAEREVLGMSVGLFGLGIKYYMADDLGLRFGLHFLRSSESITVGAVEFTETMTSIGIAPGLQYHMFTTGPVTVYIGGEVVYGMISFKEEETNEPDEELSGNMFGLSGLLGFEYYPLRNISFGAEYRLGFDTTSTKFKSGGQTVDGPTLTNIGISTFSLTLGVYF